MRPAPTSKMLGIALALTGTFLIVELVGAYLFNSLALLSDAAHMFTDAAALAIALAAVKIGQRPADESRTFGYRRFEILAAAFNALLLFAVAAFVLWEGISRLMVAQPVESGGMLVIAVAGLVVNLIAMRLLSAGQGPEPQRQRRLSRSLGRHVGVRRGGWCGADHHGDRLDLGGRHRRHRHWPLGAAAHLDPAEGYDADPALKVCRRI